MNNRAVVFTQPGQIEMQVRELGPVIGDKVHVKTEYTVVSGGTVFDWRNI